MTKKESVLKFFLAAICAVALVFSLLKPAEASAAAFAALSLCARKVVPGVFIFMVAAKVFVLFGAAEVFSRATGGAVEKLFGVSAGGAAVIFFGLFSGYPCGAAIAGELIKAGKMEKSEAERILPFATAASPAFLLSFVSSSCGGLRFGLAMLFSQLASALLLLFLSRKKGERRPQSRASSRPRPLYAFTLAIKESGAAAVNICSYVTFFYVFSSLVFSLLPARFGEGVPGALVAGMLEISCGFARLGKGNGAIYYFCGGAILGFSGFSVLLQSADALGTDGVSMKKYLLGKSAQALFCGAFAALFGTLSGQGLKNAFLFFGTEQRKITAIWQTCALLFAFFLFLAMILIFFAKFFALLKKIFKKLWKKNNL